MTKRTPSSTRPGFTLVELLVGIAIIGLMAGMVLFALAGARQDARTTRTNGTIQKINDVILQRWEEYRYRAVKLNVPPEWLRSQPSLAGQPLLPPREGARLRMLALRDVMRMEMPDRFTDLLFPPSRYAIVLNGSTTATYADSTGLGRDVPQRYNQLRNYFGFTSLGPTYFNTTMGGGYPYIGQEPGRIPGTPKPTPSFENQSAELLYAIVATSTYNGGSPLENFRPTEIGDTDGDTYPEFLDAWGEPIRWIRWPAGHGGPLNATYSSQDTNGVPHVPDAMDPVRTDWRWANAAPQPFTPVPAAPVRPWTLVPLIVSAGNDGAFDLVFDPADSSGTPLFAYAGETFDLAPGAYANDPYFNIDPYMVVPGGTFPNIPNDLYIASQADVVDPGVDNWSDNLTSHALLLD